MKFLFILFPLFFSCFGKAQNTLIPDSNFEQALINLGLDTGPIDGQVLTVNIDTVTTLNVYQMNINNLTGIEDFTALKRLWCGSNNLSSINISQNTNLIELMCSFNQLSLLDVSNNLLMNELLCNNNNLTSINTSNNSLLRRLNCSYNQITSLNVSNNLNLEWIQCNQNSIPQLDFSNNPLLEHLECQYNQLTALNLSLNPNLILATFDNNNLSCVDLKNGNNVNLVIGNTSSFGNPNLTCILVDDSLWAYPNWAIALPNITFSENCAPCIVGIEENELIKINIYPNPATDHIYVQTKTQFDQAWIYNTSGKLIKSEKFNSNSIDVKDLPKGIYFLQLIGENEIVTKKFVKQ